MFGKGIGALFRGLGGGRGGGIDFSPIKPKHHRDLYEPGVMDRLRGLFDYDSPVDNPMTQAGMGLLMQPTYSEDPDAMATGMQDAFQQYKQWQRQKAEETAREEMLRERIRDMYLPYSRRRY